MALDNTDYELIEAPPGIRMLAGEDEAADYWTPERMRAATPVPIPEIEPDPARAPMAEFLMAEEAEPDQRDEPRPPDGDLDIPEGDECYRTTQVADMKRWPYLAVGKIFMTFDGNDFVGSAWTIGESAVFTAGHCVFDHDTGSWADSLLFLPQFNNGAALGSWTSINIVSLADWVNNQDFAADMAAFVTDRPVRPESGALGWWANTAPATGAPFNAIGYPASPAPGHNFNGQIMWHSVGNYTQEKNPFQMCNNMTGGCSGGPWVMTSSGGNYAKGLNSFRFTNEPERMYSPEFGGGFLQVIDWLRNQNAY